MTELFSCDFENGIIFDPGDKGKGFDIVSVSGGTIAASASAKYLGNWGCACTPLNGYRAGGARIIHNPTSGKFRQAFWFHPNSISLGTNHYMYISRNYHYDASQQIYAVYLAYNGSSYVLEAGLANNTLAITAYSSDYTITNTWHLIETYWQAGTPGSFELIIDGASKETITATNDEAWVVTPGLGCLQAPNFAISGTCYFDRWRANDDGASIGA